MLRYIAVVATLLSVLQQNSFCALAGSVSLNPSNFHELVDSAVNPFLVLYGAAPNADQDDSFEQFSDRIQTNGVAVGRVDCTDKKSRKLCQGFVPTKLPQLALYVDEPTVNPYTKKYFRKPMMFEGTLAEKDIERFIAKNLPNAVERVVTMQELVNNTMLDWQRMPTVLYASKKDTIPAVIKVLSGHYKNRLQFKHVKTPAPDGEATTDTPLDCEICEAFNIAPLKGSNARLGVLMVTTEVISNVRISPRKMEDEAKTQGLTWFDGDIKNKDHLMKFLDIYALVEPHPVLTAAATGANAGSSASSSATSGDKQQQESTENTNNNPNTDLVFTADSLKTVGDFSSEFAWIVGVVKADAAKEIPFWKTRIHKFGEGMVRVAEVRCGNSAATTDADADAVVEHQLPQGQTFGQLLCSQSSNGKIKAPYVQVIPYEGHEVQVSEYSGDRRKMVQLESTGNTATVADAGDDTPLATSTNAHVVATVAKYAVKLPPAASDGSGKVRESAKVSEQEVNKSVKEIKRLAWESFPESEVTVVTEFDMQNFVSDGYIRGDKRALSIIILSKSNSNSAADSGAAVPSTFRNVALSMKQYYNCQIGMIQDPSIDYLQSVGNPPLPSMLILYPMPAEGDVASKRHVKGTAPETSGEQDPSQVKFALAVYDRAQFGPLKFMSMLQFAMSVYAQVGVQPLEGVGSSTSSGSSSSANTARAVPKTPIVEISTPEAWEAECGGEFRGLCAVGIFDHSNGNSNWEENLALWTTVRAELYKENALADALMAYKFVYINGFCQHEFLESQFGVTNLYYNVPTVLVFSSSKQRYAMHTGAFKETEVRSFLKSMLTGRSSVQPIVTANKGSVDVKSSVSMLSPAECQERLKLAQQSMQASAEVDAGGDSEMSAFLAEIKKEEEEKLRLLELELEQEKTDREAAEAAAMMKNDDDKPKDGETKRRKVKRVVKKKKK